MTPEERAAQLIREHIGEDPLCDHSELRDWIAAVIREAVEEEREAIACGIEWYAAELYSAPEIQSVLRDVAEATRRRGTRPAGPGAAPQPAPASER